MSQGPGIGSPGEISRMFKGMSAGAARRIFVQLMKKAAGDIFSKHEPGKVKEYIEGDYALVEEELPENVKSALREVGPQFEDTIYQELRVENIKSWMREPHWIDDPETRQKIIEVHEIIDNHPRGDEWLHDRIQTLWSIALDYPNEE